jgi:hypothetical protein
MLIDIYELQEMIQTEDYDAICRGDDAVAEESLESARAYVGLASEKFGIEYDEEDPAIRLAVNSLKELEPASLNQTGKADTNSRSAVYTIDITFAGCRG